jgi:hypothetical protein
MCFTHKQLTHRTIRHTDGNQQASLKDPLHIPVGPITRARSKMMKEALSGLIQEIWAGKEFKPILMVEKILWEIMNQ